MTALLLALALGQCPSGQCPRPQTVQSAVVQYSAPVYAPQPVRYAPRPVRYAWFWVGGRWVLYSL